MQAVMILRGNEPTWAEAKRQLGEQRTLGRGFIGLVFVDQVNTVYQACAQAAWGTVETHPSTPSPGAQRTKHPLGSLGVWSRNWLFLPQPRENCSEAVRMHGKSRGQETSVPHGDKTRK